MAAEVERCNLQDQRGWAGVKAGIHSAGCEVIMVPALADLKSYNKLMNCSRFKQNKCYNLLACHCRRKLDH